MDDSRDRRDRSVVAMLTAPYASAAATLTGSPAMRALALLTAINALGNGLFATISILFYTQHLGFSVGFVSATLLGATLLAISGDLLSGRVSDSVSPKPMLLAGLLLSALASAALLAVEGRSSFAVVLCLLSLGQGLCMSSNTALIRRLAGQSPALSRASLRSLLTLGISAGALLAGIILADGGLAAFRIAILTNAATFVIAASLLSRIAVPRAAPGAPRRPLPVLPDRRFALFSLANGAISIHLHALPFALPLWTVLHHPELTWIVGLLVALNALLGAALQVPASAGIASIRTASSRLLLGAAGIAVSYLFFVSGWTTSTLLLVTALLGLLLVHTAGEVLYAAGTMELLFRLAPEEQQGQYGAFYGVSSGTMASAAPVVLGAAIATSSGWGWWALAGATMLLAGVIRAVSLRAG